MSIPHLKLLGFGAILAFIALTAGHNGQAGFAQAPCTVTVSAGSPIQAAIDSASAGAVICVEAGSYLENLAIRNKQDLTLQGAGRDNVTLDGSAGISIKKAAIAIEKSEKITIQGFRIVNSRRAIDALNTKQLLVIDNRFEKNLRQSLLLDASEGELRNNLVLNTQKDINGENGVGIHTFNSVFALENVTVSGSAAEGISGQGDPAELGSTLTIQKCTFTNNGRAIALTSHSKATIRQSEITDNGDLAGIALYESATATIEENLITGNIFAGMHLAEASEAMIIKNEIKSNRADAQAQNGRGINVVANSKVTIRGNTIMGNPSSGVLLFDNVQATVTDNTIASNGVDGIGIGFSGVTNDRVRAEISNNLIQNNRNCGVATDNDSGITISGQSNTISGNRNGQLCGDTSKFPAGFGGGK